MKIKMMMKKVWRILMIRRLKMAMETMGMG